MIYVPIDRNSMSQVCRIVVTTGPERGKVFELEGELVHIGRAPENQIVLEDPGLSDHQATILHKNGRYAIFRPDESEVEVDGSEIPSEQWVWLPLEAKLQFGRRTSCQFHYEPLTESVTPPPATRSINSKKNSAAKSAQSEGADSGGSTSVAVKAPPLPPAVGAASDEDDSGDEDESPAQSQNGKSRRSERKKKKKRTKNVARFITDKGGPMVELGADGHLPELALQDGPGKKSKRDKSKSSSPVLLYSILGLSMAACLAMLLIDPTPTTVSETSKASARRELVRFFGMSDDEITRREREIKSNPKARWPWPSNNKPVGLMGDGVPARWQKDLRAAKIARTRRDSAAERAYYRRVLDQLNAEDHDLHFGLTGDMATDAELKKHVSIAISR